MDEREQPRTQEQVAFEALAKWVEYALDLSDNYSINETGDPDELVGCRRPKRIWVEGRQRLIAAKRALGV